jgi:hypothetical protein
VTGHQTGIDRTRVPVCATALAILVLLPTSCSKPRVTTPINWVVTVGYANGAFTYNFNHAQDDSRCNIGTAQPNHANGDITLCQGDTVQWAVSNASSLELVVFVTDQILDATTFATFDGDPTPPQGHISPSAKPGSYEYFVALYDKSQPNSHMRHADPIIIIGGS